MYLHYHNALSPSPNAHTVDGLPPMFVTQPPTNIAVSTTELQDVNGVLANLVLPCEATGIPMPTITWFREGTQLDPAFVMADGTLAINVTENEAMRTGTMYNCLATNVIGANSTTVASVKSLDVNVSIACKYVHEC